MKFLSRYFFISLSLIRQRNYNQKHDIHEYWIDHSRNTFGYMDTVGNIKQFERGINQTKILHYKIPHLHHFYKNQNYTIMNHYTRQYEKSHVITPTCEKHFRWKDTTLSECIHDNNYIRCNYFGIVSYYNLIKNQTYSVQLEGKSRREYLQQQTWMDGISFSINNANEFSIHDAVQKDCGRMSMKQKFKYKMNENTILQKMKTYQIGDVFYILFHYGNHVLYLMTVKKLEKTKEYQMTGLHCIRERKDVVDCDFQYPFVVSSTRNELDVYEIKSNLLMEKIITKKMPNLPYFTSILFYKHWILFNGQSDILSFVYLVYS